MSWLRIDDGYDSHEKLLGLGRGTAGDARRWTWTRVLIYANRHGSAVIPAQIEEAVPRASASFLNDCIDLGLVDREGDRLVVHDWFLYADAPVSAKVSYYMERHPDAGSNEVARAIIGKRDEILRAVREYHESNGMNGSQEPLE